MLEILELEADARERRVDRLRRASHLPPGKTFERSTARSLARSRSCRKLRELARGDFVEHAAQRTGLRPARRWQEPRRLRARPRSLSSRDTRCSSARLTSWCRSCSPPSAIWSCRTRSAAWTCFDLLILDDIGYVQQTAEEAEVLFTFIAERYERRSILITSNLVFSEWDRIFKNPMATAAAIDRLVHHAVILEFNVPSYRTRKRRRPDSSENTESAVAEPA